MAYEESLLLQNIAYYRQLLRAEADEAKRRTIAEFLVKAEYQLKHFSLAPDLVKWDPRRGPTTPEASAHARRWRAKAEEVRTVAESMRSESARHTLLRLAHDYETLSDSWEKAAHKRPRQIRNAG
jgi:hypothetical protein